jgi:hypothetical protein
MKDDEIAQALAGLDSALGVFRRQPGQLEPPDTRIRSTLASMRHELALYRAVARTVERSRREKPLPGE